MNIRMEDIKKAVDESIMENIRKDAYIKILKDIICGVTGALIDAGGWKIIGTEDFPCPGCGSRDGYHSASDCEVFEAFWNYKGRDEAQKGGED